MLHAVSSVAPGQHGYPTDAKLALSASACRQITLNGSVSSQYLTAILMAAPLAQGEGAIEIECKDLISQPYVEMTIKLMERFNVKVCCCWCQNSTDRNKQSPKTLMWSDSCVAAVTAASAANLPLVGCCIVLCAAECCQMGGLVPVISAIISNKRNKYQ